MSPRDIASLAFRVAGILVIVQPLTPLSEVLSWLAFGWRELDDPSINVPVLLAGRLVPIAICGAIGLFLIVKSRWLAAATIDEPTGDRPVVRPVDIHAILFSVVGVLLIGLASASIPRVFHNLAVILSDYRAPHAFERRMDLISSTWIWATGVVLQLAIGCGLLIWGKHLARSFYRSAPSSDRRTSSSLCPHCGHPFFLEDYRHDSSKHLCSECKRELPAALFKEGV